MKSIKLSLITIIGLGTVVYAGGDISPVTPYETEDEILASDVVVTAPIEIEEEVIALPVVEPIIEEEVILPTVEPIVEEVLPPVAEPPVVAEEIVTPPLPETVVEEAVVAPPPPVEEVVSKAVVDPITPPVSEPNGLYIGAGTTLARYDANCECVDAETYGSDNTYGVLLKAGYHINDYIAIEGRGITTPLDDDGGTIEHMGVFLKPSYPINDVSLYGLVGLAKSETSGTLRKTDVNGLAWGAGLDYNLNKKFSLFADYERLFQKSDSPDLDTINIGVNYNF